jgi:hypothetical protein
MLYNQWKIKKLWNLFYGCTLLSSHSDWLARPTSTALLHGLSHWRTFSTDFNQLMGSIPSQLGDLTSLNSLLLSTWIGLSWLYDCHACSHFLFILFEQLIMIWLATSIRYFVMDLFWFFWIFVLIALLKLCAAAALNVVNTDQGT